MPAKIHKMKGGGYEVRTPNMIHGRHMTRENALAQQRLLNAVDHGWRPTHKKKK
jgi:hypothetical protein